MKTIGLTTDPRIQDYLSSAHRLVRVLPDANDEMHSSGGMGAVPVFRKTDGKNEIYFLGGFKSFYTVIPETTKEEIDAHIERCRNMHTNIECLISVPFEDTRATLVNYMLDIRSVSDPESRFDLYEKKTRNLVRKSYKNEFKIVIGMGKPTDDFYPLYTASMRRLGGFEKNQEWFAVLEKSISENVIVFSLFDGDRLIAANYCLRAGTYIFLMFNISDPAYWEHAINDRLYDELIRWSIENSLEYVDFGPSVVKDDSHAHFKVGFGAQKWSILTVSYGTVAYRLKRFVGTKIHNMRLRFKLITIHGNHGKK